MKFINLSRLKSSCRLVWRYHGMGRGAGRDGWKQVFSWQQVLVYSAPSWILMLMCCLIGTWGTLIKGCWTICETLLLFWAGKGRVLGSGSISWFRPSVSPGVNWEADRMDEESGKRGEEDINMTRHQQSSKREKFSSLHHLLHGILWEFSLHFVFVKTPFLTLDSDDLHPSFSSSLHLYSSPCTEPHGLFAVCFPPFRIVWTRIACSSSLLSSKSVNESERPFREQGKRTFPEPNGSRRRKK